VPTVAESGVPGYDVTSWYGFFAPTGTPRAVVMRVNADVRKVLALPAIQQRLTAEGADVAPGTPEQFAAYIKTEMTKWAQVVKKSGAKAE